MKLWFKQRFFSWFDSYDIYDENGNTVFTVEGQLSWGHRLHILNTNGEHISTVQQRVLTLLPKFEFYIGQQLMGTLCKEFTFFKPAYDLDCNGWHVDGDFFEWEYAIMDSGNRQIAQISKELFQWTDTYSIEVSNEQDALPALMVVLAIDAEKCSRN
ncbi:MAG: LURP-one-related family protein [Oscillospiraceae bacterium]|nr:LURP-one-related family protein [Oscillospiraceae bacterium]